jgi:tryptophanyl-tRNA synthetase
MNRAHAYKAAVAQNVAAGRADEDAGINMGVYGYPILMAADILAFDANVVPVGRDQVQHVEITRDIAQHFNHTFGETLVLPEYRIQESAAAIPGLDGRKMSKSYGNTIPLFADGDALRKLLFKYVTDSSSPTEPKDPNASSLFALYQAFAGAAEVESMRARFAAGIGWGTVKQELFVTMDAFLAEPRQRYRALLADRARLDEILAEGALRARARATPVLERVRQAIGVRRR